MAVTLTTPNTLLGLYQPKGDAAKLASNLATVVLGTLLITICAKINVPVWPVPVTLQGFAIAPPMPLEATPDWIAAHRAKLGPMPRIARAKG